MVGSAARTIVCMLVGLASGCRQRNASHCGNQQGNATCALRDAATPYCDECQAINDGCVPQPPAAGCGEASSGPEPATTVPASTGSIDASSTAATQSIDSSSGQLPEPCGNGVIDEGEACDGDVLPPDADCTMSGFGAGTPGCVEDCTQLDYTSCPKYMLCGNGEIGFGEDCDGRNLGGETCDSFRNLTGDGLVCTDACMFDTTDCAICRENGESCTMDDTCCNADEVCAGLTPHCCVPAGLGLCQGD